MRQIKVNGKDYKIEFSFGAVEDGKLVSDMYNMLSGAYIARNAEEKSGMQAMIDGSSEMMGDAPRIAIRAFKTGLTEHQPDLTDEDKTGIMKEYIKESKINLLDLFSDMRDCMEEDGFFDLSGISQRIQEIADSMNQEETTLPVEPQDHKKKQTSAK